ncbi:hypothetical protein HFP57_08405 [Parasphingopyxis algicola]|uniref:hypothetical protein n=1 Tax=Parasphingopyxis algicola TaxID=2026624 RepID=UPI0015A352BA|nr:hypothetical protein [Parasphingopyxis algicola]QLC25045.1 hypothetical protein HFP57_08405 [Parasphingopyxis algicola]
MSTETTNSDQDEIELMACHGITKTSVDRYHYKTWSYSNISDAAAQARREAESEPSR